MNIESLLVAIYVGTLQALQKADNEGYSNKNYVSNFLKCLNNYPFTYE
jgi:hypothetical protein